MVDTTPPLLSVPADMVIEASTIGGAYVTLPEATATDLADPNPVASEDHASGFFPLGTTAVTATATDSSGNTSSGTFNVTVVNTTPPLLSVPADMIIEASTIGGAYVTLPEATATDLADLNPAASYSQPSGFFPLGTTVVTATAIDAAGNATTGSFNVSVVDTTPPVLSVPANMTVEATGPAGAAVTLPTVTVTDAADPSPLLTYQPPSGSFPLGTTLVTATATDSSGNTSSGTFSVTVVDTTPPVLSVPADMVVEANAIGGAQVTLPKATATDLVDPSPGLNYSPPSGFFPLGVTPVTVTATDATGNTATGTFTVTVQDTTPPVLSLPANVTNVATTAGGAMLVLPKVAATDLADPNPTISYDHAAGFFPLGTTMVTVAATNASGNTSTGSFTVTVNTAPTSTAISSSSSFATWGQMVILTATINTSDPDAGTPSGSVTFMDGGTPIGTASVQVRAGVIQAVMPLSSFEVGNHPITAGYSGNSNFLASTFDPLNQSVTRATPVVTWIQPSDVNYGTALGANERTATASVPGSFVYSFQDGTVPHTGQNQPLSVVFNPSDAVHYSVVRQTVSISVETSSVDHHSR